MYVSAASIWEAGIKSAVGRLDVDGDLVAEISAAGFEDLPINGHHAWEASMLPPHHHDPFDRMLVAQAFVEDLVLASADRLFERYDVALLSCRPAGER